MLVLGLMVMVPLATEAAVYEYVNTQGNLQTVVASSPEEAMEVSTNIAANSGVMLLNSGGGSGTAIYKYVNSQGYVQTITANSAAEALNAPNIAPNSGVILFAML